MRAKDKDRLSQREIDYMLEKESQRKDILEMQNKLDRMGIDIDLEKALNKKEITK